jgi:hypothetical protein
VKHLIDFCKKLQIRQIITILLARILLILNTACSGVNAQGVPKNTLVQAGGANNPYQRGGDKYTYKFANVH